MTRRALHLALLLTLAAACQGAPAAPTAAPTTPALTGGTAAPALQPVADGPVILRPDITVRQVVGLPSGFVKLARHPLNGDLYLLSFEGLFRVAPTGAATLKPVATAAAMMPDGRISGLAFGPEGNLYLAGNLNVGATETQGFVRRGVPTGDDAWTWETLATTAAYPLSATPFDHLFNGVAVSADGQWVYVNSGSRTDHGEVEANGRAFPDVREVALTARIFRLPAAAAGLALPNDEAALDAEGWVFARGLRNAFDLEFAPTGELFAVDNGPDADYADELNVVREGGHYGFPWRFGAEDNPQRSPDYNGALDRRLNADFTAVRSGTYRADPSFPPPPAMMIDPIANQGPDAAQYRANDGAQRNAAAEGRAWHTFTPHRSPLGLVFLTAAGLPADLQPPSNGLSALVLSWGSAGGTLTDRGQDLLHLRLTRAGDSYTAVTTQIARAFKNPIDAVLIENRLYVLEFGAGGALWELTFAD